MSIRFTMAVTRFTDEHVFHKGVGRKLCLGTEETYNGRCIKVQRRLDTEAIGRVPCRLGLCHCIV